MVIGGDECVFEDNDVDFARIGSLNLGVEEGNMDGKVEAIFIFRRFGTERRSGKFFDDQRMEMIFFLDGQNIIRVWFGKIDPG